MIQLKVSEKTAQVNLWEEKLIDLSLAHKIDINSSYSEPILVLGRDEFKGEKAITAYFPELEKFVINWRKCACEG